MEEATNVSESASTRLSVEHWEWKRLRMCRKTDYAMNEL